jgi:hypothetical protein
VAALQNLAKLNQIENAAVSKDFMRNSPSAAKTKTGQLQSYPAIQT